MAPFRTAAGLVFLFAGAFAYYGIVFEAPLALALVIAGVAVLIAFFLGHRAYGGDIAIFVVSLLVLAAVASGFNFFQTTTGPVLAYYSAASSQISPAINQIELFAKTDTGSISINLSPNASLGYSVIFRSSTFGFQFFPPPSSESNSYSFANETKNGVLFLNASAIYFSSLEITLGEKYFTNISASCGTGSIDLKSSENNASFGSVSLSSGTGSITANFPASKISNLYLHTGTGSVALTSSYLAPSGPKIPIIVSSGTGSVMFKASFPSSSAVSLNASAGFGGISQNLPGFVVTTRSSGGNLLLASEGDLSTAATSFLISITTGTGSVNVNAYLV